MYIMKILQYSIVPPLEGKSATYYQIKIQELLEELTILSKKYHITLGIYDLIDESNRITGEIIIQKKRIDSGLYLEMFQTYLIENDFCDFKLKYRLFRPIKENETLETLLSWFENIGNKLADSFVIIGNYKNKHLRTDVALKHLCEHFPHKEYGCVIIPHRPNELERCRKRISTGCSFFVSQIIVDETFTKKHSLLYDSIKIPIYFTITHITSNGMWDFLLTLGVKTYDNFENKVVKDKQLTNLYLNKLIQLIKTKKQYINFEILSHLKKNRIIFLRLFSSL